MGMRLMKIRIMVMILPIIIIIIMMMMMMMMMMIMTGPMMRLIVVTTSIRIMKTMETKENKRQEP